MLARRQFIKVGIAGAALLAVARLLDRPLAAPAAKYRVLADQDARMIAALAPVVLAGSFPEEAEARSRVIREVVESFDRAVFGLSLAVQGEIAQLFSFLNFAPTRLAFAGLWTPVEEASGEDLKAFLLRWRASRFDLQRASYHALTQLIQAAWYDNRASWAAIGYPGPPALEGRA